MPKYSKDKRDVNLLIGDLHIWMSINDIALPILPTMAIKKTLYK